MAGLRILALNGGSSSFKLWLGDASQPKPEWEAHIDLKQDLETTLQSVPTPIDVIGHRIVHGGPKYRSSVAITPEVREAIAQQAEIAPSHNRLELAAIEAAGRVFAGVPQVAVFDTTFHTTIEPPAYVYPGPYDWFEQGIRRYGFHGISYQHAARSAAEILQNPSARLIICHLGNGASVCAVRDGKSVDTSMGFTPLEGLMMGSRSGSVDPGIITYLLRHHGYTADQLDQILNRESGLLGVSGVSSDMREVLAAIEKGNARAKLAFDIYVHRLCREVGAMYGVLGGADALVFTGGVGENCAPLREAVGRQFNLPMLVVQAEEEWEIARECDRLRSEGRV